MGTTAAAVLRREPVDVIRADTRTRQRTGDTSAAADFEVGGDARTQRLWRSLAYRPQHHKEVKEFDRFGDRLIGMVHRAMRSRRRLRGYALKVVAASEAMTKLAERDFDAEIEIAREAIRRGNRGTDVRVHAFAVVREAVRRTLGLSLYVEQVMGGWTMEDGCLAEMLTGEGKTVTACLTAAVQGWAGHGVHVITVNDYLARRDAELNKAVYKRLGLTVGIIQHDSEPAERREAYASDITYSTDQQVIFDYLRDRLHAPLQPRLSSLLLEEVTDTAMQGAKPLWTEKVVQRGLHAAIIDEADSVLIDQATTPAVIGMASGEDRNSAYYRIAAELAADMEVGVDYLVDLRQSHVSFTDRGRERLEDLAGQLPPFWSGPRRREELVHQALVAKELFENEDDYIVREGEVEIVDPQTGRVLEGRQWQLGLHQAMQAKEDVEVTAPHQTMARVSYQRLFQMYRRISGMTGTAWEVRTEIWRNHRMPVVRIPPHRPVIRKHARDRMYVDQNRKFAAVADRIQKFHKDGRPVLVGTRSVDASEQMSALLNERNVPHNVLNAVRHEQEAAVVSVAGKRGAVTVATNMAGRGTDILLGDGVADMGGLVVIATERHESLRIDRQLFGRAGRQGDPGRAEVFVALDDEVIETAGVAPLRKLLRRFPMLERFGVSKMLWWQAQRSASSRQRMQRHMASEADLWFDRAMYYERR